MPTVDEEVRTHRHLRRYLLTEERVVVATRRHWARLLEPILTTAAATLVAALLHSATSSGLIWLLWTVPAARLAYRFAEWRYEWFVATDKRLILAYGLIVHKVAMMPLVKVTDMGYFRTLLGQVLGYGRFVMESAGQDQALRQINYVPQPDATYRILCDTMFGPKPGDKKPAPPPPAILPTGRTEPRPTTAELPVVADAGGTETHATTSGVQRPSQPAPAPQPAPEQQPAPAARQSRWSPTGTWFKGVSSRKGSMYDPPRSDGSGPTVPDPFL